MKSAMRNWSAGLAIAMAALGAGCLGKSEQQHLAAGQQHLAKDDVPAAIIEFKNALSRNADSGEARLQLGQALLRSGDAPGAVLELRKAGALGVEAERVEPVLARAMLRSGDHAGVVSKFAGRRLQSPEAFADLLTSVAAAHVELGDLGKARAAAQAAVEVAPAFAPAVVALARMRAADGEHDEALRMLDVLQRGVPADEPAGVLKGEVLWRGKQDVAAAEAAWRSVLERHPQSFGARSFLVALKLSQGRLDEAKGLLAQLAKDAPMHLETLFHRANIAFVEGDYRASRSATDLILKGLPNFAPALELAGAAELRLNNSVQAEAFLARAVQQAPELDAARRLLAQLHLRNGQPDKTLDVLRPALEGARPDAGLVTLAGEAYLQLGDARGADAMFKRAAAAAPDDPAVRTALARAQLARGQSTEALKTLSAVSAGDTGYRADLLLIGTQLGKNDLPAALRAADALIAKSPDLALAHTLRGNVLLLRRETPAAARAFEAALAKDPRHFPAVAGLAGIEVAGGKRDLAKARIERFLAAEPRNTSAWVALAELVNQAGGTPEEVAKPLREAVRADPARAASHLSLIRHWLNVADAKQALQAAQTAAAALPNDLAVLDALGRAQMAAGNGQQAISTFRRLVALRPQEPAYAQRLADAHLSTRDTEGAVRAYARALELQPGSLAAQRGLAVSALMQGRHDEARRIALDLQKQLPREAAGFTLKGDVELLQQAWPAAIAEYRAALERAPATETVVKLHGALVSAQRKAEADKLAVDWQRARPRDAVFMYYMAGVALANARHAEAEALYRQVLEQQPHNALALNNLAWLLATQGKPGAVPLAERANALAPDTPAFLDTLAGALAAEKQLKRAIELQRRAVALGANEAVFKLHLAKLLVQDNQRSAARPLLDELAALGDRFKGQQEVARLRSTL